MLHVFEQACDLISEQGKILSLVAHPIGNGPFSLVLPQIDFRESVDTDSPMTISGDSLSIGQLKIFADSAIDWDPRPPWEKLRHAQKPFETFTPTLLQVFGTSSPQGSFATLIVPQPALESQIGDLTLNAARDAAGPLIDGLLRGDRAACIDSAKSLAGLGGGLTPQGDDFLLGCFLAVWAGLCHKNSTELLEDITDVATVRTSPLSAAWIRSASRGDCGEPWHDLFDAVLADHEAELRSTAGRLVQVGHTSGADALAGFLSILTKLNV